MRIKRIFGYVAFAAFLAMVLVPACGGGGGGDSGNDGLSVYVIGHYEGSIKETVIDPVTQATTCDKLKTTRMSLDITQNSNSYDGVIRLCDNQFCEIFSGFVFVNGYHLSLRTGFVGPSNSDSSFCSQCAPNARNDCSGPKSGITHMWEMDISPDGSTIKGGYEGVGKTCSRATPQSGEVDLVRDSGC